MCLKLESMMNCFKTLVLRPESWCSLNNRTTNATRSMALLSRKCLHLDDDSTASGEKDLWTFRLWQMSAVLFENLLLLLVLQVRALLYDWNDTWNRLRSNNTEARREIEQMKENEPTLALLMTMS